jgi:translocation protein SEC72
MFKTNKHDVAIARYTLAGSIAVQRPPWEANAIMREEVSAILSNRSAAYAGTHDYISALADAESVIQLRKNWPKGHFRKAKALSLMGRYADAKDALKLGLSFEPDNTELELFLQDVERAERSAHENAQVHEKESPEDSGDS